MNATGTAAWVGAVSGLVGLLWNVYTKVTAGPKLAVTALAGMVMIPSPPHNPRMLQITVHNIGTAPTTIINLTFQTYASWWMKFRNRASISAVLDHYRGPDMPYKIEVGGRWVAVMEQEGEFDEWLRSGNLWCEVVHSFSKRPTRAKIRDFSHREVD